MKPQDLRIGCWYNGGIQLNGSTQAALSATESKNFLLTKAHFEVLVGRTDWHLMINPIPLTDEWLLNFGFDKNDHYACYSKIVKSGEFVLDENFVLCDIQLNVKLEYVHQLQNLYFSLTGEELTLIEKP